MLSATTVDGLTCTLYEDDMGCETELVCKTHGVRFWCGYGSYRYDAARALRLIRSKQCEIVGGSHDGSYEKDGHLYCISMRLEGDPIQIENYSSMPVIHLDEWPDSDDVRIKYETIRIEQEKERRRQDSLWSKKRW